MSWTLLGCWSGIRPSLRLTYSRLVICRRGAFHFSIDAYIKIKLASTRQEVITNTVTSSDPVFNQKFKLEQVRRRDVLVLTVWDRDQGFFAGRNDDDADDDLLGRLEIPVMKHEAELLDGRTVELNERFKHQPKDHNAMVMLTLRLPDAANLASKLQKNSSKSKKAEQAGLVRYKYADAF